MYRTAGKMLVAGILTGAAACGVKQLAFSGWDPLVWQHSLVMTTAVSLVFVGVLVLLGRILHIAEIGGVIRHVAEKLGSARGSRSES